MIQGKGDKRQTDGAHIPHGILRKLDLLQLLTQSLVSQERADRKLKRGMTPGLERRANRDAWPHPAVGE